METQIPPPSPIQPRQFGGVTILVVIFLIIATAYFLRSETPTTSNITGSHTPAVLPIDKPAPSLPISSPDLIGTNGISVNNQPAGNTVLVSKVTLENPGWVVIHDERKGNPGLIIAAARFNAGTYTNRIVDLLGSQTKAGTTYYALLNSDDGDRQFDYTKDLPLKDPLGNTIMAKFSMVNASSTKK